jgi:uncharacterized NAD(P)/FAD-binding protein YdhS
MKVAVIGGGPAGVAFLDSLVQSEVWAGEPLDITIFEPARLARGRAYRKDLDCALVNRQAGYMSVREGDRGHFLRWLREAPVGRSLDDVAVESFVSRRVFGDYLVAHLASCRARAERLGWRVVVRPEPVLDVAPAGGGALVRTAGGAERFDHAVLCMGTGEPADPYRLTGAPGFHPDPYPLATVLPQAVGRGHVVVLGTGLSAVDVVLGLLTLGHEGPITLVSRRGVLPGVRTPQRDHELRHLTVEAVDRLVLCDGRLRLSELWRLFQQEVRAAGADPVAELAWLGPGVPAHDHLRHQLDIIDDNPMQAVMMAALHRVKLRAWRALAERSQRFLVASHNTRLKAVYNPMPPRSARTLLGAMESGRLAVSSSVIDVGARSSGGFEVSVAGGARVPHADVVIGTTRQGLATASGTARPLLEAMTASGSAVPHPLGGVRVRPGTGELLSAAGRPQPSLRAVGELTSGEVYYAGSLFAVVHAAAAVARALSEQDGPEPSTPIDLSGVNA